MANESSYSDITSLIGNIYEGALLAARENDVMSSLVTVINEAGNSQPRIWSTYSGGTFATITEATDMTSQAFTPTLAGTITKTMYGSQYFLTDLRISGDTQNVVRDAASYIGGEAGEHIDKNLVGLFSSLTGGTVYGGGTSNVGGTLTWANIFRAQAYARAAKIKGRYSVVLRPEQWYYLTSATSGVPTLMQNTNIAEAIIGGFYQASFSNLDFYTDANLTSGTACVAGMFGREAIELVIARALRIEQQRDGSRGGGGWEANATMQYGYGAKRPTYGVQLIGTSA